MTEQGEGAAAEAIRALSSRGWTIGFAESLTGGLLIAEFVSVPGASAVVRGGVVAYATPIKHSLLGVDADLLADYGPVHPEVARQLANGARTAFEVDGRPAEVGLATTGVAGPDPQNGIAVGTVHLGVSTPDGSRVQSLALSGDRNAIRAASVAAAVGFLLEVL